MAFARLRTAALAATVVSLTLTACAPTGQPAGPGVTAIVGSETITNARVDEVYQAWLHDTQGTDVANRRQIVTIEMLTPRLVAAVEAKGIPISDQEITDIAANWIQFKGVSGGPTQPMIDATAGIVALWVLAQLDPTYSEIRVIADEVAAESTVSPRVGTWSTDALLQSVNTAVQAAQSQQLEQFGFTEFQNVSAFTDENRSWLDRG